MFVRISQGVEVYKQALRRRDEIAHRCRVLERDRERRGLALANTRYARMIEDLRTDLDVQLAAMARALGLEPDEVERMEREVGEESARQRESRPGEYGFCG